jgi:hypothetical protein
VDPADELPLMEDPLEEPGLHEECEETGERPGKQPAASLLSLRLRRRPSAPSASQTAPVRAVATEPPAKPEPEPAAMPDPEPAGTPVSEAAEEPEPEPEPELEPSWAPAPEPAAKPEPEPSWASAPEPPAEPSGPSQPEPEVAATIPADIVDYWSGLRDGRTFPSPTDLDSDAIVSRWPNSILLTCAAGDVTMRAAALFKPLGAGLQTSYAHGPQPIDFSPMVVEWIISLAQDTVRRAQPLTENELFQLPDGPQRYAACALPLSTDQRDVDHVLCYVRTIS